MNANFALDFRNDQIKLLHLQEGLWVQIGIVAIDDPDLDAALGYMRSTAMGLSPRGVACKLVLPDEAVLYTTVGDLSSDPKARAAQIARALIGRTPYQVADLVYDWTDDGSSAHMAVIARETLDEAEAFAVQHRFNPVAFAAWPKQGPFQGEADFGTSETARDVSATSTAPIDAAAALSAKDFEMGDTAVSEGIAAAPLNISAEIEPASADQSVIAEIAPKLDAPKLDAPEVYKPEADLPADPVDRDQRPMADPLIKVMQTAFDPIIEVAAASQDVESGQDTADLDETLIVVPDAALLSDAPNFAAPTKLNATPPQAVFAPVHADEAPMALDVPIDEPVDEDPAPISGPSAGKAQTLLAEFAARREAALGKADTLGRFEPAMSAGKTAAPSILADSRTEAAPKIAATATQNLSRTKESSLGSKPAVKRPAPKARGSRSALMGFVLTILLLIALAAAAAFSSFISSAWNVDSATTAVASVQPSVADEVAADLPDDDVMAPRVACCGAWFRFDMKFESYENCSSHSGRSRSSIR
jgi:hypothetical protein